MCEEQGSIFGSWETLQIERTARLERGWERSKVEWHRNVWADVSLACVRVRPAMMTKGWSERDFLRKMCSKHLVAQEPQYARNEAEKMLSVNYRTWYIMWSKEFLSLLWNIGLDSIGSSQGSLVSSVSSSKGSKDQREKDLYLGFDDKMYMLNFEYDKKKICSIEKPNNLGPMHAMYLWKLLMPFAHLNLDSKSHVLSFWR